MLAAADSKQQRVEPEPERQVQVAPEHYDFENYDEQRRWMSYWYQIRSAMRLKPKTALEIGAGSGVFRSYLQNVGVDIKVADIDATRGADFVVDVAKLDEALPEGLTFDVVAAFQVLEHVPFELFESCLESLARRGEHVLISLPTLGWTIRAKIAIGAAELSFGLYPRYPYRKKYNSQHCWELGPGYSPRKITRIMKKYFDVVERFRIKENPYHYMWVLRSKREETP